MGSCSICYESNTKTVATLQWEIDELVMKLCSLCVSLFMLAWKCVWLCLAVWLSVRDRQRTKWQWTTGWQNEREALFVACWWWSQTDQSAHDFHQLAEGLQHPQLLMNIRRIGVCFYMPVDIMNMDMMISHQMKCALEPCFTASFL